jgi:hypothetical protein
MCDEKFKKTQIRLQLFDIIFKFLGIIIGICVGVWQFQRQQSGQNISEFKRTLWKQQFESYGKTTRIVGAIISSVKKNGEKFNQSVDSFSNIYWGEMYFIEDTLVSKQMLDFKIKLAGFNSSDFDAASLSELISSGDNLIKSLRESSASELNKITK